nr:MAG TPA: hypothetical protein [Caudoviricetes sp.]DAL90683.1 MAG TPA: hypothetical protein [Caudoviricetes sp.]
MKEVLPMEFLYHLILGTLSKLLADIIHDVIKRK